MNPSTEDILKAVSETTGENVFILQTTVILF